MRDGDLLIVLALLFIIIIIIEWKQLLPTSDPKWEAILFFSLPPNSISFVFIEEENDLSRASYREKGSLLLHCEHFPSIGHLELVVFNALTLFPFGYSWLLLHKSGCYLCI